MLIDKRIDFRYVTAETALHRNSVPVTITTGHMHQDRQSPWTATPGIILVAYMVMKENTCNVLA